ncbi:MAG: enolase-phosphatase E1 [Geoglossum simile]|nr:MAG: enolase-phosphatase E1 [Geoglossum simile]
MVSRISRDVLDLYSDTSLTPVLLGSWRTQYGPPASDISWAIEQDFNQFPYALSSLPSVLSEKWDDADFKQYRDAFPESARENQGAFESVVRDLTERDVKVAYLKSLQGYLWRAGYESSSLRAPIFPDVPPALTRWHESGLTTVIYSSGSVNAQKLFFQHTDSATRPDLRGLLHNYYDTVIAGPKTEKESYQKIAEAEKISVGEWLFLSDNVKEVAAATDAGMKAAIVVRPGNGPLTTEGYTIIRDFSQVTKFLRV